MLRMTMIVSGEQAKDYFRRALSRGEYYLHDKHLDQELAGRWHGRLADRMGVSGDVTRPGFERLCDNLHPVTGTRLTPRFKDGRRVGYDCNFHVPKSVSLMLEFGEDRRIVDAFREAVRDTMTEMEADVRTRVRRDGADTTRHTGEAVWAEFVHFTARPVDGVPDPHLHAHCIAFNATWDPEEQRFKAADFGSVKRDAPYFQAAFHARMKTAMVELGYRVERRGKGWEIAGVPDRLIRAFSRRTEEIERLAQDRGITDAAEKAELGAKTRQAKLDVASMDELRALWTERVEPGEARTFEALADQARRGRASGLNPHAELASAWDAAVEHVFARRSVVRDRDLVAAVLDRSSGGVTPLMALHEVERRLAAGELLRGSWEEEPILTTPSVHAEERSMLDRVHDGRGRHLPLVADHTVSDPALSAEQAEAVRQVLGSQDSVILLRGRAGVGKTRLMQEVVAAIESGGLRVQPVAPTAMATHEVLRGDGFGNATTIAKLLDDPGLQHRLRGQVLWVDEAGLVSVPEMARLIELCDRTGARLLLTGDTAQHHAVQRGDAMKLIEEFGWIKCAEVEAVRRQRHAEYRAACEALAKGDVAEGFARLESMGSVRELDTEDRSRELAEAYCESTQRHASTLVVAPTHAEGEAVTAAIRDQLKQSGRLGIKEAAIDCLKPRHLTEAEKADAAQYRPGDVVEFRRAARGIRATDRAVVAAADDRTVTLTRTWDGKSLTLPLEHADRFEVYERGTLNLARGDVVRVTRNGSTLHDGRRLSNGSMHVIDRVGRDGRLHLADGRVIGANFRHLAHGYCVTSQAAQGRTVDHVILAQSGQSFGASSRQQFYVSVSRGRHEVTVFTDDAAALKERILRDASRASATRAMGGLAIGMPPIGPARDSLRAWSGWMLGQDAERRRHESERSREQQRGERGGHDRSRDAG